MLEMIENKIKKTAVINWCLWALYTFIIVFLASRHEPWGDEYHVWSMSYRLSLADIWDMMRVEGHFSLWNYLVAFWVKLFGMDWRALYMVSLPLMSAAAWLLLFKVNFPLLGKILVIFSAPFIYDFPVIARCYALIPPVVIGLVIAYQNNKPLLFCVLLGLLANTHAYMEGMVAALWLAYVYEEVALKWRVDHDRAIKALVYSMIVIAFVLFAFIQVGGGIADAANGVGPAIKSAQSSTGWISRFYASHQIYFTSYLKSNYFKWIPDVDLVITLIIATTAVCALYKALSGNGRASWIILAIIVISCGWQVLFAVNIYGMSYQRVFLVLIPVIMMLCVAQLDRIRKRSALIALACIFLLNTSRGIFPIGGDITKEYSQDLSHARQIDGVIPPGKTIYIMPKSKSLVYFCYLLKREINQLEDIETFPDTEQDVYLISTRQLSKEDFPSKKMETLFKGNYHHKDKADDGIEYFIYKIN